MITLFQAPPGKTGITGVGYGYLGAFAVHLPSDPIQWGFYPKTGKAGPSPDKPTTHFNVSGAAAIGPCSGKPLSRGMWQFGGSTTGFPIFLGPGQTTGFREEWRYDTALPQGPQDVHSYAAVRIYDYETQITKFSEYTSRMYDYENSKWKWAREVEIFVYRHIRGNTYGEQVALHLSQMTQYRELYQMMAFGLIDIKADVWGLSHQLWTTVAHTKSQNPWENTITGYLNSTGPSISKLKKALLDATAVIELQVPGTYSDDYGELALNAAQFARSLDMNSIEFLKDIPEMIPSIRAVIDIVRKKPSLKNISTAYLAWKYGVSMSYHDMGTLVDAARSIRMRTDYGQFVRSRTSVEDCKFRLNSQNFFAHVDLTLKVWYDPYDEGLLGAFSSLDSWGLLPTRKRVWEVVPFSFIVDWFIDISDALDRIDHRTTSKLLRVFDVILGRQIISPSLGSKHLGFTQDSAMWSFKYYTRRRRKTIPSPPYRINRPDSGFHNWVEATALILSRGK